MRMRTQDAIQSPRGRDHSTIRSQPRAQPKAQSKNPLTPIAIRLPPLNPIICTCAPPSLRPTRPPPRQLEVLKGIAETRVDPVWLEPAEAAVRAVEAAAALAAAEADADLAEKEARWWAGATVELAEHEARPRTRLWRLRPPGVPLRHLGFRFRVLGCLPLSSPV